VGKVSVVINTLNEEENLPKAILSVGKIADEIIVCDMKSTDKTVEIAKKAKAKVFTHERTGYVEPARNYAIEKATSDWILILDADERITKELAQKLKSIVNNPKADYYRIARKNIIFRKWIKHSRWWPDYNIRFFKKGHVVWSEIIHSVPETKGKGLDLSANEDLAITHDHYKNIDQYIQRLNRYTTWHAELLMKDGYKFNWKDLIGKPIDEFVSRYFQGEGYKDGLHGLALGGLQAFSEFILYLKVWQKKNFKEFDINEVEIIEKMKESESDLRFWQADTLFKSRGGLVNKVKRKLKLP